MPSKDAARLTFAVNPVYNLVRTSCPTPVSEPVERTPVREPVERTPVREPVERTPVREPVERTPVREPRERTVNPAQNPVIEPSNPVSERS